MSYITLLWIWSGILGFILLYVWGAYNSFIRARNQVKTDFADIDVQLKRRASLIENLVEIVREYAKHENETLTNVAEARSMLNTSHNTKEAEKAQNILTSTLKTLFAVSENYPKLEASQNFKQLQTDILETENKISDYREVYNQTVLSYNTKIQTFPNLVFATIFGFNEEELFQPEPLDRKDIKIKSK